MEPVKRSREISPQNAAFRQSGQHRVSCRLIRSSTPAPLRGPLRPGGKHVTGFSGRFTPLQIQFLCHLKGTQDVTGLAFVSPVVHVGEPKPSSSGRRCRRRRRMIADFRRKSEAPQGPILKKSSLPNIRTYPQGFAQLLPEEGACVTCFPSRPHRHSE